MDVTCQSEVAHTWIARIARMISGGIVLSALFSPSLFAGSGPSSPLLFTRLLIVLGILFQIPLLFSKENYFDDFPSFFLILASLFSAFLSVIAIQCFYGLRISQIGVGSVNTHVTFSFLAQLAYYFLFFILCLKFFSRREGFEQLTFCMAILVFGITLWGIAERFMGRELLGPDHPQQDSFGPFVNPNHYSAFIGLSLPLFFGHLHQRYIQTQRSQKNPPFLPWKMILSFLDSGAPFLILLTALALAGCFLSGSRLGAILISFSSVLYCIMTATRRFKPLGLAGLLIVAGFLLVVQPVGLGETFRTFGFDSLKAAVAERLQVSKESLGIFRLYPLLGSGLGTYGFISPKVITVLSDSVEWDHAHNDYVELLAETGAVGFLLFISTLGALFFYGLQELRNRPSAWSRPILLQSALAIFNIAVMEAADFPLKIPSLALLFIVQCALIFSVYDKKANPKPYSFVAQWGLTAIYCCAALFLSGWAVKDYQSAQLVQNPENREQNLEEAAQLQPLNSRHWYELGLEYLRAETAHRPESNLRQKKALEAFRRAAELSPTYGRYWFSLGGLEYQQGYRNQGIESLEKAVAWAPYKTGYLLHLIAIYLKESEASETVEERNWNLNRAKGLFDRLSRMKTFPSLEVQKHWMGGYAEKMAEYQLQWNPNKKVAP